MANQFKTPFWMNGNNMAGHFAGFALFAGVEKGDILLP
jgi:hypothetical protein